MMNSKYNMESKNKLLVFLLQFCSVCLALRLPGTGSYGGGGIPGSFGGGGIPGSFGGSGAQGPFGGISRDLGRPISPGGRIPTPEDDFGSINDNTDKDSPQQGDGSYLETGVKDSPQIRPDSISGDIRRPISPGGRIPTPEDDFGSINDNTNKDSPQQGDGSYLETGVKDSPQIRPDSISGEIRRPISPGGRIPTPEDDFGSINDNTDKDSPQQGDGSYLETGVKDSPQIRPDSMVLSKLETGVQEDIVEPIIGCPGRAVAQQSLIGSIGTNSGVGGGLCLELMCGSPCEFGYKVDPTTGCKTCKCLRRTDRLLQSCPNTPIKTLWNNPSTRGIVMLTGKQFYALKPGAAVEAIDESVEDTASSGTLCDGIDTGFTSTLDFGAGKGSYTVYFSGGVYSIYSNMFGYITGPHSIYTNYEKGSPNPLGLQLPPWVKKIDSAFVRGHKLYLFFKYDENVGYFSVYDIKKKEMRREYPKRTAAWWVGLPLSGPDAAINWRGKIYFIVGDDMYVFEGSDARKLKMSRGPMKVMGNFVKCSN